MAAAGAGTAAGTAANGVADSVTTGAGVTSLPEESYTKEDEIVTAQECRAEGIVDEPAVEPAVESAAQATATEPTYEADDSGGYARRGSGGGSGGSGGESSTADTTTMEAAADITGMESVESIADTELDLNPILPDIEASPEIPEYEQPAETVFGGDPYSGYIDATDNSYVVAPSALGLTDPYGAPAKTGSGVAAPIIGVASGASSLAAAGLGLSHMMGSVGNKGTGADTMKQDELPVVTAKESNASFAGNMKGEYALLGSALPILFSGASIMAGMGGNKSKNIPDDRFKIGYGTSAILSGGAIQERG